MPESIELFAGGGGMARGVEQAGFGHAQLVEWDARAVKVLQANAGAPPAPWSSSHIQHTDVREWLSGPAGEYGGIDLIAGGPPCQPFSLGGVHNGHSDERNMFPAAADSVRLLRPKLAIFENVPGLLRPSFMQYYEYICDRIRFASFRLPRRNEDWAAHHRGLQRWAKTHTPDYSVSVHMVNAADFGTPQVRRRIFLVAIRSDIHGSSTWRGPVPTHSEAALVNAMVTGAYWKMHGVSNQSSARDVERLQQLLAADPGSLRRKPWRTIRDAIHGLPAPIDGKEATGVSNHAGIPGARIYVGHTGSDFDWPSKTIKAGVHGVCGGEAMIRYRDGSLRYLTVREAARIQGFPDDHVFPGARSPSMWTIGNAVAVDVARTLASQLRSHTKI